MAPLYTVLGTVVAAISLVLVTGSWVAYFAVMGLGLAVAFVLVGVRATRLRAQVTDAAVPGRPRPWIEWVWPPWVERVALGYLGLVAGGALLAVVALVVAAIIDATR